MSEEGLSPDRCALVVVDVQNDFCHPEGALSKKGQDLQSVRDKVPNIQRILSAAREIDIPRIFLRGEHGPWTDTDAWVRRGKSGKSLDVERVPVVHRGSWGAEFFEVEPQPDEFVITKHRYSGFAYTPLELVLDAKQCTSIVLVGMSTNVCVEATARDAIMRGYYPIMVEDCVSSGQTELHNAALTDIKEHVGSVVSLDEVLTAWGISLTTPATESPSLVR